MSPAHPESWPVLSIKGGLDTALLHDVRDLLAAAEESDGNPPLSEQTVITLGTAEPGSAAVHTLLLYAPEREGSTDPQRQAGGPDLAGAAVVVEEEDRTGTLEVAIHPNYRNLGAADRLIGELQHTRGLSGLQAWAHGSHVAAAELAARYGFGPVRELWKMRLTDGTAGLPDAGLPEGVMLRSFVPGQDEDAWLAANAAAFAHHPEQGSMTRVDLEARMAEDWFDPAGFLLAVDRSGTLLGFHWTKIHPVHGGHPPLGEVYVVGVTPGAQGLGLGKALTVAGIRYLQQKRLQAIMLYVDADNTAAVALYRKLGFTRWDMDVLYGALAERP
ncbi:mycothiol synthase [Pseudarthrobacter sp. J64]|uniref:mycothiol synthase n=1 Tax=Pseudarthrobacter sp. J64 TaxID=3116485 RepID=UPI002E80D97A|nr:mycothiol synthase [Pseudarthrobacter sp. J64]MEE2568039.1 mycothiol synthase [Pseudarthrobacter sp. J64]